MPKARYTPKPKAVNVFVIAEQFRLASKLATLAPLFSDRYKEFEFVRGLGMLTASMACSTFSLELYFKCLIRISKRTYGLYHNLDMLFALLTNKNQDTIRDYFYEDAVQVRAYVEKQYGRRGFPHGDLFSFCLNASSKAFVQMRYAFERPPPRHKGWLGDRIVECARQTILDKRPLWEQYQQISMLPETSFGPTPLIR